MAQAKTKSERIEARTTPDTLAILRRAAEIEGRSVSDFVVSAAEQAARETIAQTEAIYLSKESSLLFASLIVDPPAPNPAMKRAFEHHKRLIGPL